MENKKRMYNHTSPSKRSVSETRGLLPNNSRSQARQERREFIIQWLTWINLQINRKIMLIFLCVCGIIVPLSMLFYPGSYRIRNPIIKQRHHDHSDSLSFIVVGDWGGDPSLPNAVNQSNVANAMLSVHKQYKTSFVVSVGDHLYDHGMITMDDPRWKLAFEDMYDNKLSPWYATFGNHDMRGSIAAQVNYSEDTKLKKDMKQWIAPDLFYAWDFTIPFTKKQFRVLFLDTNGLMCNHEQYGELEELERHECDEMFYKLPQKHIDSHPSVDTLEKANEIQAYNFAINRTEQINWMKRQIASAHANDEIKFILMVGHHGLWSKGPHGIPKVFNEQIQPIIRSSDKIIAWFCGHNHALEHYIWDKHKHANDGKLYKKYYQFHQFLSGSGGREVHPMIGPNVSEVLDDVEFGFLAKKFGFVSVHAESVINVITVKYWDQFGKQLYEHTVEYPK